ncbi:DUF3883 domain-containing protein [Mycoplasmopsis cynos]|uniref:DUF3883 domain-containing protein n=2 Tax=Mycoplasmopsis cynos TaxID=171284 RepID=UPI002B0039E5|nr:DUF3883 domain-containing protein [Mycoplasmopsis cynos]WQQ18329.1 DUF3883 domain-containing protein [Mycoplasmopsis cynos]
MKKEFMNNINTWIKTEEYKELLTKEEEKLKVLKEFKEVFNESKISNMDIDNYVIGKHEESFCYYVEQKLKFFGNISGRTNAYQKFVIYWNSSLGKYVFGGKNHKNRKGFGSNVDEIFTNIKEQLIELIKSSKKNDYKGISLSPFNNQFKNKVAFLYNNENQIPIYSDNHLNIILSSLNIKFNPEESVEFKRKTLFNFYQNNSIDKILSTSMFASFIYSYYGFINKSKKNIKLIDLEVKIIDTKEYENKIPKVVVYDPEVEKKKKEIGTKGEEIVLDYLSKNMNDLNIKKIYNWCFGDNQDDSKGYDFSYITNDGKEFFIEVKTTTKNLKNKIIFEMSKKEFSIMNKNRDNYFIYFISNIEQKNNITINRIPAKKIGDGIPSNYSFNLEKIES